MSDYFKSDIMESICLSASGFHYFKDRNLAPIPSDVVAPKTIVVFSPLPILVPDVPKFSQPAEKFLFLQDLVDDFLVLEEKFQNYRVIYSINHHNDDRLKSWHITPQYCNILPFIYHNLNLHFGDIHDHNALFLYEEENAFTLILFKQGIVQMVNKFNSASYTDMLYYLLNVLAQFNIVPQNSILYFLYAEKNRDTFLKKYFEIRYLL